MDGLREGYWVSLNGVVERPRCRLGVFGGRMDVYIPCTGALGAAVRGRDLTGFDTYRLCSIPSALSRVECFFYPSFILYFFGGRGRRCCVAKVLLSSVSNWGLWNPRDPLGAVYVRLFGLPVGGYFD